MSIKFSNKHKKETYNDNGDSAAIIGMVIILAILLIIKLIINT